MIPGARLFRICRAQSPAGSIALTKFGTWIRMATIKGSSFKFMVQQPAGRLAIDPQGNKTFSAFESDVAGVFFLSNDQPIT